MDNPFDFFEKIYCINLDRRPERWEESQENFKALGISDRVERFSAMDHTNNTTVPARDRGKFGCTHSHIELIRQAKSNNIKNILIFEDDNALHNDVEETISKLSGCIKEIPENWEIFYLSGNPLDHPNSVIDFSEHLCVIKLTFTTHALAINHLAYDQILKGAQSDEDIQNLVRFIVSPHFVSVDGYYMDQILPNAKSYICKKLLFSQRVSFSDIDFDTRDLNKLIISMYKNHDILSC